VSDRWVGYYHFVYRRRGAQWQPRLTVPFGGTYTTRLLPGFSLVVDPRR
jgi:hypothetical protein